MTSPYHSTPTRAERDRVVDRLRDAVGNGDLTVEEFDERLDAAYGVANIEELQSLVANLPQLPQKEKQRMSNKYKAIAAGAALLVVALGALALNGTDHTSTPAAHVASSSASPTTVLSAPDCPSSTISSSAASSPASAANLSFTVIPAGCFSGHDPADKCGAFGTAKVVGGSNCYLVVKFTNTSSSPVHFTPADLRMTDQTGDTYSIASVLPSCYDSTDVNESATLPAHGSTTVQLCYPVMTGALPQTLTGTRTLEGLSASVPESSVDGTWGGA